MTLAQVVKDLKAESYQAREGAWSDETGDARAAAYDTAVHLIESDPDFTLRYRVEVLIAEWENKQPWGGDGLFKSDAARRLQDILQGAE